MNVAKIRMATIKIGYGLSHVRGQILKRRRLAILVAVLLLIIPLVLTGNGSVFLFNAMILGSAGSLIWGFTKTRRSRRRNR